MYSNEEMEKIGEDIGKGLLKIASPKTILCGLVCLNLAIAGTLFYLFK